MKNDLKTTVKLSDKDGYMQRTVCVEKDTLLRDVKFEDKKFGDPAIE
jgi:hypothetical protein